MSRPLFFGKITFFTEGKKNIGILLAVYSHTNHSRPPEDNKLLEIKPDLNWLTAGGQYILPRPESRNCPPLSTNIIYT